MRSLRRPRSHRRRGCRRQPHQAGSDHRRPPHPRPAPLSTGPRGPRPHGASGAGGRPADGSRPVRRHVSATSPPIGVAEREPSRRRQARRAASTATALPRGTLRQRGRPVAGPAARRSPARPARPRRAWLRRRASPASRDPSTSSSRREAAAGCATAGAGTGRDRDRRTAGAHRRCAGRGRACYAAPLIVNRLGPVLPTARDRRVRPLMSASRRGRTSRGDAPHRLLVVGRREAADEVPVTGLDERRQLRVDLVGVARRRSGRRAPTRARALLVDLRRRHSGQELRVRRARAASRVSRITTRWSSTVRSIWRSSRPRSRQCSTRMASLRRQVVQRVAEVVHVRVLGDQAKRHLRAAATDEDGDAMHGRPGG